MISVVYLESNVHGENEQSCSSSHVWPLKVTASQPIFVFARDEDDNIYSKDVFIRVASLPELTTLPTYSPAFKGVYYLADTFVFSCRSQDERLTLIATLEELVDSLNAQISSSEVMAVGLIYDSESMIRLTRESLTEDITSASPQHVWPLKITATSLDEAVSSAIFVLHAAAGDDLYCGDVFEAVASVSQMEDLPENNPGYDVDGSFCPYYRKNAITFIARSYSEAEELWDSIVEDVDDLTRNMKALADTQQIEVHVSTGE